MFFRGNPKFGVGCKSCATFTRNGPPVEPKNRVKSNNPFYCFFMKWHLIFHSKLAIKFFPITND